MQLAAAAQALLNAVMAANPIMLVITLIAALVAGLTYFFTCTNTGKAVWSSFTSFLSGCVQGIIGFFSGLGSTIVNIFNSSANGARNAWNGVVGWFRGLPGSIAGFFGNAGSILYNAGASIISGFLNGLKSMWSNVTGWISGIGDWIKAHKGPISYDRRLLIPAGQAIMTGFAQGLNTGFDSNVETAISRANRRLATMPLNVAAATTGDTATPVIEQLERGDQRRGHRQGRHRQGHQTAPGRLRRKEVMMQQCFMFIDTGNGWTPVNDSAKDIAALDSFTIRLGQRRHRRTAGTRRDVRSPCATGPDGWPARH